MEEAPLVEVWACLPKERFGLLLKGYRLATITFLDGKAVMYVEKIKKEGVRG